MKASVAPNAKIPASHSASAEQLSANASAAAIEIATYGVPRVASRRETRLGIWRFVPSE